MSLTSQLQSRMSPLNQLLDKYRIREQVQEFVDKHNAELANHESLVSSVWGQSDYALTGTAATYYLSLMVKPHSTMIDRYFPEMAQYARTLSKVHGAILMALLEKEVRRGSSKEAQLVGGHVMLESGPLLDRSNDLALTRLQATAIDLDFIAPNLNILIDEKRDAHQWEFQKTFRGSSSVGGADANLCLDRCTIVDIRTTRKSMPLDADGLIQQIMYAILGYPDIKIETIGFLYVRHGVYVEYPVGNLPQLHEGYLQLQGGF